MTMIKTTVINYLDKQGWHHQQMQDRETVTLNLRTDISNYRLAFDFKEELDLVILYVLHEQNVIESKRSEVAEYLTRANYGIVLGNYEMDFTDGEIRYKVSIDVEDGVLSEAMVENMISASIASVDRYFSGLMAIQYGDMSAIEAISRSEKETGKPIIDSSIQDKGESEELTLIRLVH